MASGLDGSYSVLLTANYLNASARPPHLIWDPLDGSLVQLIQADRKGRYAPLQARTEAIQIVAVSPPGQPFTSGPCVGLDLIMEWLRSLGIPDIFPLGPPTGKPREPILQAGHYALSERINVDRILRA